MKKIKKEGEKDTLPTAKSRQRWSRDMKELLLFIGERGDNSYGVSLKQFVMFREKKNLHTLKEAWLPARKRALQYTAKTLKERGCIKPIEGGRYGRYGIHWRPTKLGKTKISELKEKGATLASFETNNKKRSTKRSLLANVAKKVHMSETTMRRALYVLEQKDAYPEVYEKMNKGEITTYKAWTTIKADDIRIASLTMRFFKEKRRWPSSRKEVIDYGQATEKNLQERERPHGHQIDKEKKE